MRSKTGFSPIIVILLIMLATGRTTVYAQTEVVIAEGNPPLTAAMAAKTVMFLEWSLDISFTEAQKMKIAEAMIGYWKANKRDEITGTVEIAKTVDKLLKMSPRERDAMKGLYKNDVLKGLRDNPGDEITRLVMEVYNPNREIGAPAQLPAASSNGRASNPGRVGSDGFTGIYVGTRNIASSMSSVQLDYVTFLPGGNVYWTLPAEGLLYFDPALAKRANPDEWGTYQVSGNTVRVTIGSGLQYVFVKENGGLRLQPHSGSSAVRTYSPLAMADGLKLSGTYRRFAGDPAITFASDGRFRDEGIFRNFGTMGRPDGSTYQDDGVGGTGTYTIAQNTLELKYADGRVKRAAFTVLKENAARGPIKSFRINYENFELD